MAGPGLVTGGPRPAPLTGLRGLPAVFWWIWASLLINWLGAFAGPMLAFSLTADRGYSASYAGFVVSLPGLGAIAGNALGGVLADRYGRRVTLVSGHVWTAAAMAALGLAQDRTSVAAAALAVGIGTGVVRPAAGAVLADVLPAADRQRAFALNYWAVNAGLAIAAVLAGLLVRQGYTLLFLADAATTLLCAMVVLVMVPETLPPRAVRTPAAEEPSGGSPGSGGTPIRRDLPFVLFTLLTVLFALAFEQRSGSLAMVMAAQGHSPAVFSLLNAVNAVLVVVVQIPLTRLLSSSPKGMVLCAGGLLAGAGLAMTAFADGPGLYVAAVVVWTFGEMFQTPAGSAVVAERAPTRQRGRYLGLYAAAWSTAGFLGPAGGGWVLDRWGSAVLWTLSAVLAGAAGCGWLLITGAQGFRTAPAVREEGGSPLPRVATEGKRA
ncbi:MFS transporter [Streptomyces sp. V4I2]|uniref:MFS transporter n=1 Tax=Streptomyces sp. V4I2 TaxID=3042280 RepID=UPI00277DAE70|nr:MFS transporter [Streptomyces sp. V4I2]MDQ1047478.1 MFS family permease [Streptomyces sp. V4I2]